MIKPHDRHLLRTVTDEFPLVAEGRAQPFDGDLDDYRNWLNEQQRAANRDAAPRATGNGGNAVERREQKRQEAERRQQAAVKRKPLEQRVRKLEQRMEKLHGEKTAIENTLAEPHSYDDANKDRLKETLLRQGQISGELEQLEAEWLDLHEELEALAAND
ncbi:MAG TPA: hypothetical protein PK018_10575 [Candidatus Competibacter sp.]|nr:hypothetical protein [Candidatus Competibacter sp.]